MNNIFLSILIQNEFTKGMIAERMKIQKCQNVAGTQFSFDQRKDFK